MAAKTVFIVTSLLILLGCSNYQQHEELFMQLAGQEKVIISLADFDLTSVPPAIKNLKNVKDLTISKDYSNWSVISPASLRDSPVDIPPFNYLPEEIGELTQLESLTLDNLDIKKLPEGFTKLQNLRFLNLSFNKLDIANEVKGLALLKSLEKLIIVGNKIDEPSIAYLRNQIPGLQIVDSITPTSNP